MPLKSIAAQLINLVLSNYSQNDGWGSICTRFSWIHNGKCVLTNHHFGNSLYALHIMGIV